MNELINTDNEDIFSAVNDIENVYIKLGRELAIKELEDKLIDSNAYSTGVNYGNNLGEEFGFYYGVATTFEKELKNLDLDDNNSRKNNNSNNKLLSTTTQRRTRILHIINNLKSNIQQLLLEKPSNGDFDKKIMDIKFLYKKFSALLLIKDKSILIFVNKNNSTNNNDTNANIKNMNNNYNDNQKNNEGIGSLDF